MNNKKNNDEPLKQTILDLTTLEHIIENMKRTSLSGTLLHTLSAEERETKPNFLNLTTCMNCNGSVSLNKENNSEWLATITEIYNSLQTTVSKLQICEETHTNYLMRACSCKEVDLTDQVRNTAGNMPKNITREKLAYSAELYGKFSQIEKFPYEHTSTEIEESIDIVSNIQKDNRTFSENVPQELSIDSVILYYTEYCNLSQQCKQLEIRIEDIKSCLTSKNNEMLQEIEEINETLSVITQENAQLQHRTATELKRAKIIQEKLAALRTKKSCLSKKLHEKQVFLRNIATEITKLDQCLHSFSDLEKMVQLYYQKKCESINEDHQKLLKTLYDKREEIQQDQLLINQYNAVIAPTENEIASWKKAGITAIKEAKTFSRNIQALLRRREELTSEYRIIARNITEIKNHLKIQNEIFKIKEKKCRENKKELQNKCNDLKSELQRIVRATLSEGIRHEELKQSYIQNSYKNNQHILSKNHSENRIRKETMCTLANKMKNSVKITQQYMMHMKNISLFSRHRIACELAVTTNKYFAQQQGIEFLQNKIDNLTKDIEIINKQVIAVHQSTECSSAAILALLMRISNMNENVSDKRKEKNICFNLLGFRITLVVQYVEGKARKERKIETPTSQRDIKNIIVSLQYYKSTYFIFLFIYLQKYCSSCEENIMYFRGQHTKFNIDIVNKNDNKIKAEITNYLKMTLDPLNIYQLYNPRNSNITTQNLTKTNTFEMNSPEICMN